MRKSFCGRGCAMTWFAGDASGGKHPIGPYVADFACVPARLIVEVDGETHSTVAELAHDQRRDAYLRTRGWYVFRVTNEDVYKSLDSVLDGIVRFLPPPRPS